MHCLTLQQIAGQGDTHTHSPAYKTAQMADRRSVRETHTHTQPCPQDRTAGRSLVRETHTHSPAYKTAQMADRRSEKHTHTALPTRPHRWQIAGQGDTHTQPCLQDRTDGRSPVRDTHTQPCLQDRTDGRSPVREAHTHTYTHSPTYS